MAKSYATAAWFDRRKNSVPMKALATRVPEVVVAAFISEAEARGITVSKLVAEGLMKFRPDLPWGEDDESEEA